MPHEITMLGFSVILGLIYLMAAGALSTSQRGLKWNTGNRDNTAPLTGAAARAARAQANFMETFPFFAVAVLAAVAAGRTSEHTAFGTDLYVWARFAYLPIYIIGVPYLRTAVWLVSLVGLIQVLSALIA